MAMPCPTPAKHRYATHQAATVAAGRHEVALGYRLYPYLCLCGWVHLSKRDCTPQQPDEETLELVAALGEAAFEDLVSRELHGRAHPLEAGALRQPRLAKRWENTLHGLQLRLEGQVAAHAGDRGAAAQEWRRRTTPVRLKLAARRREARACRISAAEAAAAAAADKAQQRQADERELRRLAGEAAVDRLIAAHGREFACYLAEECRKIGVEVPSRIRKYLDLPVELPPRAGEAA